MFAKISYSAVVLVGLALLLFPEPLQQAQAETTIITAETTEFPSVVEQGDTLIIEEDSQAALSLDNYGTVINRGTVFGAVSNQGSGVVYNEQGAVFGALVENYGEFENHGNYASPQRGTFHNGVTGHVINYGFFDSHTMSVANEGSFDNMAEGTFVIFNGVSFDNSGTVNNAGEFYLSKTTDFNNIGGMLENSGSFFVGGYGTGSGSVFTNDAASIVNNTGEMTNHDFFFNEGVFENYGLLSNRPVGLISPLFNNTGALDNNEGAILYNLDDSEEEREGLISVSVRNFGSLENSGQIVNEGDGAVIVNECGATFNDEGTVEGKSVIEECPDETEDASSSQLMDPLGRILIRLGYVMGAVR